MIMKEFYFSLCQKSALYRYMVTAVFMGVVIAYWWYGLYVPLKRDIAITLQRLEQERTQQLQQNYDIAQINETELHIKQTEQDIKKNSIYVYELSEQLMRALEDTELTVMQYIASMDAIRKISKLTLYVRGVFPEILRFTELFPYGLPLQLESVEFFQHAGHVIDGKYVFTFLNREDFA